MGGVAGTWLGRALAGPTPVLGMWLRVHSHVVAPCVAGWWGGWLGGELLRYVWTYSPPSCGGRICLLLGMSWLVLLAKASFVGW
jgi:hypothetical protein